MFDAVTSSRLRVTIIGVGLIFMALFVLFRFSIIKALMAIIPIGLIIGWSSGLMYISNTNYTVLTTCLGALILGIGVEYTVVLIRRYYEERGKGYAPREAMITTMVKIGRTILASGLTTIGGFAALLAAIDFPVVQNLGIMTMIAIFFALVSTLFLLPTLVVSVDSWREKRRLFQDPYSIDVVASD